MLNSTESYPDITFKTHEKSLGSMEGLKMGIQNFSENVILVDLPFKEPQITEELKHINEIISNRNDHDVIVDFFRVEIINSTSLSNLIILREMLGKCNYQLILCNVAIVTKYIFTVAGLDELFEFVDDKSVALLAIEPVD